MNTKLAKGYNGESQLQRSRIILEKLLYKEPEAANSRSLSEKEHLTSFRKVDPEEGTGERQEPINTIPKA